MLTTVLGIGLLLVLALAVLPLPRTRRWLLTASARLGQTVVLAFLGACGTFFVQPQAAPEWLTRVASPLLEGTLGLPIDFSSGLPWLILAVLAVGICLPVLIVVELAIAFSSQTAQVQSLRKEVRQAAAWVDNRLAILGIQARPTNLLPGKPLLPRPRARTALASSTHLLSPFRSFSICSSKPINPSPTNLEINNVFPGYHV